MLFVVITLAGCSAPWSSGSPSGNPVATASPTGFRTPTVAVTERATAVASLTPTATASASATGQMPSPTHSPTPTEAPTPDVTSSPVATCCGVFSWVDDQHLLVFDAPVNGKQGAYVVDVSTGNRQFVSPVFGQPSSSGLIAFPDPEQGVTDIRRIDGSLVSTIQNGGVLTWISPDGQRVVWLEELGMTNTSSLVNRVVQLKVSAIDGSNVRSLVRFEASAVAWTADNRHVVALGRAPGGTHSGIWSIDTNDGTNSVIIPATYLRALNVSPDGTRMTYLITFSGDSSTDGVWMADIDGSNAVHLKDVGAIRWAGDDEHIWLLSLAPSGGGEDHVIEVSTRTDSAGLPRPLGDRVLNGQWEVSPDGRLVAFWNETDESVMVRPLSP